MPELTVAILAVPRVIALDFGIPAHIFGSSPGYRLVVCAEETTSAVPGIVPGHPLSAVVDADIVVVPGYDDPEIPLPAAYLDTLRVSADRGARLLSICTGAFALADAGVLDQRDATTHWQYAASLRELHPLVNLLENRLFVEDGKIITSAGAGAGIDACLHIVRTDYGEAAAYEAGKGMIAAPPRRGEQRQYVDVLTPPRSDLSDTRAWAMENLGEPITVQRLAEHASMPRRTFIRHFESETGMPPMQWVSLQRILSARRLLETSDWSIERIASAAGFGSATNFRTLFRRELGTTPSAYRRSI